MREPGDDDDHVPLGQALDDVEKERRRMRLLELHGRLPRGTVARFEADAAQARADDVARTRAFVRKHLDAAQARGRALQAARDVAVAFGEDTKEIDARLQIARSAFKSWRDVWRALPKEIET